MNWVMWRHFLLVGLAGGIGTLVRYRLTVWLQSSFAGVFPWGTLAVNTLGCLLFGIIWELAAGERAIISPEYRTILLVGFMGALTTFSSYIFESHQLLNNSQPWIAATSFLTQNAAGLTCIYLGVVLARLV